MALTATPHVDALLHSFRLVAEPVDQLQQPAECFAFGDLPVSRWGINCGVGPPLSTGEAGGGEGLFGSRPVALGDQAEFAAQRRPLTDASRSTQLTDGIQRRDREQPEHTGPIPFADYAIDDVAKHLTGDRAAQPLDRAARPGDAGALQLVADRSAIRRGSADDGDVVGGHTVVDQSGALAERVAHLFVGVGAGDQARSRDAVRLRHVVAAEGAELVDQRRVGRCRNDGHDPARRQHRQPAQEREPAQDERCR